MSYSKYAHSPNKNNLLKLKSCSISFIYIKFKKRNIRIIAIISKFKMNLPINHFYFECFEYFYSTVTTFAKFLG